jgi:hypothetical protein
VKYFLLSLILVLSACSLDKNSSFWNEDPTKKYLEKKNLSKILKKNENFKEMSFEEFNLFLKSYSERADYPDINN